MAALRAGHVDRRLGVAAAAGNIELQLDLFGDYRHNVDLYPRLQEMFRTHHFPVLIAWGKYDPFFTLEGARAYLRDIPDAELHLLETGH